jgi:hypothetical protein
MAPSESQFSAKKSGAAHHRRIVKRTGDGSIIEFSSVGHSVHCAAQRNGHRSASSTFIVKCQLLQEQQLWQQSP